MKTIYKKGAVTNTPDGIVVHFPPAPVKPATFAVANPAATLTRKEALKIIWRHTHRDFRGRNFATGGSDKCILILRAGGTCSVDLDALTDAEIADKLQTAWSAEQRRIAKAVRS